MWAYNNLHGTTQYRENTNIDGVRATKKTKSQLACCLQYNFNWIVLFLSFTTIFEQNVCVLFRRKLF